MSLFLDTDTCTYALKGTYPSILEEIRKLTPEDLKIASIVKAELLFGSRKSSQPGKTLQVLEAFLFPLEIVPFCDTGARFYAELRADLEKKGRPIGPNDLILAATVLAHGGTLVTHNTKEFRRVKKLKVVDWARR